MRAPAGCRALLPGIGCVLLLSCSDGPTSPFDDRPVTALTVTPAGLSLLDVGEPGQFTATGQADDRGLVEKPLVTWSSLNPGVATVDPQTGVVTGVASGQATIAAQGNGAVGYGLVTVSVAGLTPVTEWRLEQGPNVELTAIYVVSPDRAFAVGNAGLILQWDGAGWNPMSHPDTWTGFVGVSGTSATDVFALAGGGTSLGGEILHYDGAEWSIVAQGPWNSQMKDLWAASPSDVFAVGGKGRVVHFDGAVWSPMETRTDLTFYGVGGSSPTDVYAAGVGNSPGPRGTIWHYDGTGWMEASSGLAGYLYDAWSSAPHDVFSVGTPGSDPQVSFGGVLHYDGTGWSSMDPGSGDWFNGVWGSSAGDVFVVGKGGTIIHFDGSSWSAIPVPFDGEISLNGIWGRSDTDIFVAGAWGTRLRGVR